jgi:transcriptional regulator with XRE-family HTH domain
MNTTQLPLFAKLLRRYRVEAELTQEELAERASLSARAISDLERGVKTKPHRVTVELLADALCLPEEDRAALLAAVPRTCAPHTGAVSAPPTWFAASFQSGPEEGRLVQCPPELRQVVEGLVALYVGDNQQDRQVNITVIVFSAGDPITADE